MKNLLFLLVGAASAAAPLGAQDLRLPRIFGDSMVLQQETQAPLWGWAAPGAEVRVRASWRDAEVTARADAGGSWRLSLATPAAGGPHQLTIISGADSVVFSDVWCGEVWLCGGQSNMEWTLGPGVGQGVLNWRAEVEGADFPRIRFFDVRNATAMEPAADCEGAWRVCSPGTIGGFSAVGFFFGRALHRELGVPIGLIGCNWGGTLAEAWMSEAALAEFGEFDAELERLRAARAGAPDSPSLADLQAAWWKSLEEREVGSQVGRQAPGLDDSDWQDVELPAVWSDELAGFDGVAWYRKALELPAAWSGRGLVLELAAVDDMDTVWFDGERIGGTHADGFWSTPRSYRVPAELVRAGRVVIAVRAVDTGGAGGLAGAAQQMRLYPQGEEGAALSLAGAWKMKAGSSLSELGPWPRQNWFHQNYPAALYNGMLAPIIPYALRGAIFYQGESNRGRWLQYRRLFPALIADWRARWGRGDFPFYYVQIAPFGYEGDRGETAGLREAQAMTLELVANSGMAVTMDVGDPRDIHPLNKQEVGRRLSLWALAQTYGRSDLVCSGPRYRGHAPAGGELRLSFDFAEGGLATRDGQAPSYFTVAGADRVFHPAQTRIEQNEVVVWSPAVAAPVAARYGWGAADQPNLMNAAGLPAPSFRTDDWPLD